MSLLIDLFKDGEILRYFSRDQGRMKNASCKIKNKEKSKVILLEHGCPTEDITYMLSNDYRGIRNQLGISYDSHFLAESLGLVASAKRYIYVISLVENLDVVLSSLTKCNPIAVRNAEDYENVTKAILSLDSTCMDLTLTSMVGLDTNLDRYLINSLKWGSSALALPRMIENINLEAERILYYIGFFFQKNFNTATLRSISCNQIVVTSNIKITGLDELFVNVHNYDPVKLNVTFLDSKEV